MSQQFGPGAPSSNDAWPPRETMPQQAFVPQQGFPPNQVPPQGMPPHGMPPQGPPPRRRGLPVWGWIVLSVSAVVIVGLVAWIAVGTLLRSGTVAGETPTPTESVAPVKSYPLSDLLALQDRPDASLDGPWRASDDSDLEGARVRTYAHASLPCEGFATSNEGLDHAGATSDEGPSIAPFDQLAAVDGFTVSTDYGRAELELANGSSVEMVTASATNTTPSGTTFNSYALRAFAGSGHGITLSVKCTSEGDVEAAMSDLLANAIVAIEPR